jgi:hypothetical protein
MTHKSIHGHHCTCHSCAPAPSGRRGEPGVARPGERSGSFDETRRQPLRQQEELSAERASVGGAAGRRRRGWRAGGLAGAAVVAVTLALPAAAMAQVSFSPTSFAAGEDPASVAVGDFNGDSDPDLAVANASSDDVSVLLGEAGGSFAEATNFSTGGFLPVSVAVGDFNGDSDPDLAVANLFSGDVSVLLGEAGGSFAEATNFSTGDFPVEVAVGDFNGDSDPDLAVVNPGSQDVSVLLGQPGGGDFGDATNFPTGGEPASVAVGDFNGDSDPDLAVADAPFGNVSVLLGQPGGGDFGDATNFPIDGGDPESVAVGDFNGDSDPDLAVSNAPFGDVSVLFGGAGGSFAAPASFAAGDFPVAVAVGDFDGDSNPDLAVANGGDPSFGISGGVSVMLGEAGGSFAAPANFAAGDAPVSIAVGDFDGDSDPDLAVANAFSRNVTALLNNRPPVAAADGYATDEDTRLTVAAPGVLGNDRDDGGDALTAARVSGPDNGSLTVNRDGSFSYRPDPGFSGTDSFSYQAGDGSLDSDPATVTIEVRPRAGAAPAGGRAAPAEQALAGLRLGSRCVRRSRSGQVRIPMTLRLARPGPVQVRIDRAVRTKTKRSCPKPNRYTGRLRTLATLRRLSTRPAAAGRRQLTLKLRLAPGLYRLTVRAQLDGNRLSAPARRYLHVLASRRSGGS